MKRVRTWHVLVAVGLLAVVLGGGYLGVGQAGAQGTQYPLMEQIAQQVIQKYQTSPCRDLWEQRLQPTPQDAEMKQRAVAALRNDPKMRTEFINRVAAPIVNKMFECGMIP